MHAPCEDEYRNTPLHIELVQVAVRQLLSSLLKLSNPTEKMDAPSNIHIHFPRVLCMYTESACCRMV